MPANYENGRSVYCQRDIEQRANNPLYQVARTLIRRNVSPGGIILDLGCSDLVASGSLTKEYKVIGMDLAMDALVDGKERFPEGNTVLADARQLPFGRSEAVGGVLMLDVVEHLKREEAVKFLSTVRENFPQAVSIVTMPIISTYSMRANIDRIGIALRGQRPEMGLFDRTHEILTDRKGHRLLFRESGMEVVDEYATLAFGGVSGDWQIEKAVEKTTWKGTLKQSLATAVDLIPKVVHPLDTEKQKALREEMAEYQGVYVLRPKRP